MQEAGMGMTEAAFGGVNARFAADGVLLVRFFNSTIEDKEKTKEEGRPIFKEIAFIEIMQPGNKDNVVKRKARPADKERFPEHWKRFQLRTEDDDVVIGTPLTEWPAISRSQVEELRFFNIRTVEQLAEMTDANTQNMMGVSALKQKAQAYLKGATSNDELARQLQETKAQLAELLASATADKATDVVEDEDEDEPPAKTRRTRRSTKE